MNKLNKEEYEMLKKELKESEYIIVCTKKITWLYGSDILLIYGISRIINEMEKIKNERTIQ